MVPTEYDIEWEVRRLQNHRSREPLGMRAEHLKGWIVTARKKDKEEAATGEDTMDINKGGGNIQNIRRHPTGRWRWNLCRRSSERGDWRRRPRVRR